MRAARGRRLDSPEMVIESPARSRWSRAAPARGPTLLVLVFAMLFVGVRLWMLDRAWDRIDVEELRFGLLPHDLLSGRMLPLSEYMTMAREGGSVLMAPVVGLTLAAEGGSYLGLRLGGILWNLLGFLLWIGAAARHLGARGMVVFGVLMAIGGPWLVGSQILAVANHGEAMLFVGAALLLWPGTGGRRPWRHLPALVAGALAVSFAWSAAPAFAALALLAARDLRLAAVLPVATASSWMFWPWVLWLARDGEVGRLSKALVEDGWLAAVLGVDANADILARPGIGESLRMWWSVHSFSVWGLSSPTEPPSWATLTWGRAATGAAGMAWVLAARRFGGRDVGTQFAVLFLPLALATVFVAGFPMGPNVFDGYRYLLPMLIPTLWLLAAWAVGEGRAEPRVGRWVAALWLVVMGGALTQSGAPGGIAGFRALRGWNLLPVASALENRGADAWIAARTDERPDDRWELVELRGRAQAWRSREGGPPCTDCDVVCAIRTEGWYHAMGRMAASGGPALPEVERALGESRLRCGGALALDAARGLGRAVAVHPPESFWLNEVIPRFERLLDAREVEAFHEGIGLEEALGRDFHYIRWFGSEAPPRHAAWAMGLGRAFARLEHPPKLPGAALPQVPTTLRPWLGLSSAGGQAFEEGIRLERRRAEGW